MILPGLVSVTFRQLTPALIIELATQAGLSGIEWGGDIHVPHGDLLQARRVRQMTLDAGLQVAAYGSYYRVWPQEPAPFDTVLETAQVLGAPLIRVWAGALASSHADESHRHKLIEESQRIAELAQKAGLSLAFEFHGGTLTDTNLSVSQLMNGINHPNIGIYWQPRVHASPDENLYSLRQAMPWLRNLHVFHWLPGSPSTIPAERRPLEEGRQPWQRYLTCAEQASITRFALLEFVAQDSPQAMLGDAAVLLALCNSVSHRQSTNS